MLTTLLYQVRYLALAFALVSLPALFVLTGEARAGGGGGCQVEVSGSTCCICNDLLPPTDCHEAEEDGALACGSTWCPNPDDIKCEVESV